MSSSRLAEVIEGLEVPADGASLAEVLRLRDRLDARIAAAVGEFDRDGSWALDDASSVTSWLFHHGGLARGAASSLAKTGRRLLDAPVLAAAWRAGEVTGAQVQAVVIQLNDDNAPLWAEHESDTVPVLVGLSLRDTVVVMERWRAKADALIADDAEPDEPTRSLFVSRTLDGRAELKGSFDSAAASVIETALREASTVDAEGCERTPAERRADALGAVCEFFLDRHAAASDSRHRPHVNVVVTLTDLEERGSGRTLDGQLLDADAISLLLCDANIHRVVTDANGTVLDYGRSTRSVSPALFTAVALRDGHCRLVEGCDRPPDKCHAHHVVPWEHGGETNAANLVLGCSYHHHLTHRRHWQQTLHADGTLTTHTPDGRSWTTSPHGSVHLTMRLAG